MAVVIRNYTELQDKLHIKGHLVEAMHYNAQGKLPLLTVYWLKNRYKRGERAIVARSNDWWQVRHD